MSILQKNVVLALPRSGRGSNCIPDKDSQFGSIGMVVLSNSQVQGTGQHQDEDTTSLHFLQIQLFFL